MQLELVTTSSGFYDYDVTGAGTIYRACVGDTISYGDIFNIYSLNDEGRPSRKEGGIWLGRQGVKGNITADLEKSIKKSQTFIATTQAN